MTTINNSSIPEIDNLERLVNPIEYAKSHEIQDTSNLAKKALFFIRAAYEELVHGKSNRREALEGLQSVLVIQNTNLINIRGEKAKNHDQVVDHEQKWESLVEQDGKIHSLFEMLKGKRGIDKEKEESLNIAIRQFETDLESYKENLAEEMRGDLQAIDRRLGDIGEERKRNKMIKSQQGSLSSLQTACKKVRKRVDKIKTSTEFLRSETKLHDPEGTFFGKLKTKLFGKGKTIKESDTRVSELLAGLQRVDFANVVILEKHLQKEFDFDSLESTDTDLMNQMKEVNTARNVIRGSLSDLSTSIEDFTNTTLTIDDRSSAFSKALEALEQIEKYLETFNANSPTLKDQLDIEADKFNANEVQIEEEQLKQDQDEMQKHLAQLLTNT